MQAILQGKTAIVTGAAGDLGAAIACCFLEAGANVAWLDRDAERASARAQAGPAPERSLAVHCDIASASSTQDAVARVAERFGGIDILVNNAATVSARKPLAELDIDAWRHTLDVNLNGAFLMSKWVIPHLLRKRAGVILNVASQLGHVTNPGGSAYSTSKAALIGLTRSIAVDYAKDNIRAVSISPGSVMTSRLTDRYGSEAEVNAVLAPRHPLGRIAQVAEVAQAALFLASDSASFITGTDLLVDGGYTAV
ncbi:MAG TPA: glucose 1-dehydrogenase [Bordetella sp.]